MQKIDLNVNGYVQTVWLFDFHLAMKRREIDFSIQCINLQQHLIVLYEAFIGGRFHFPLLGIGVYPLITSR